MSEKRRPNGLAGQTSPYLLQHLYNPVDWQPWGEGALTRARLTDRPIFLSIGYAACHWCHVMEHESFEDLETAELLNRWFVPVKVDREERPDLDEIYMAAVQMLTGQGGWPLNVFLTPDGRPFHGGTYWPPDDRYGRASFKSVLTRVHEVWSARRQEVERAAGNMTENLRALWGTPAAAPGPLPGRTETAAAAADLAFRHDPRWGGFGGAPKFPPHGAIDLLLREHHRTGEAVPLRMAERTLEAMALGGMFDQIGGGFSRYSVDERWLVPHFEKMLYDQALLVPVYVGGWLLTGRPLYRRVVEQTLDFVRRELTHAEGGLWSSLDADSEGHEGRFYVWTPQEVEAVLGPEEGARACLAWGITREGNFEGASIPNHLETAPDEAMLPTWREKLLAARGRRVRPGTDDKVLAAWNGLAVTAFARAFQAFGRPEDLRSAERAAAFVLGHLRGEGRLRASWREGAAPLLAYLDDHAFLARGLLDLYESTFERRWLDEAVALARAAVELFEDTEGGFFFTARDHERLLARTRSLHDGALPSGTGVLCETLPRLAVHTGDEVLRRPAERTLAAAREALQRSPSAFASLLSAADFLEGPVVEIGIAGDPGAADTAALLGVVRGRYLPRRAVACGADADLPLLAGRAREGGRATAYVCRNYACQRPTAEPEELARLLGSGVTIPPR